MFSHLNVEYLWHLVLKYINIFHDLVTKVSLYLSDKTSTMETYVYRINHNEHLVFLIIYVLQNQTFHTLVHKLYHIIVRPYAKIKSFSKRNYSVIILSIEQNLRITRSVLKKQRKNSFPFLCHQSWTLWNILNIPKTYRSAFQYVRF